MVNPLKARLKSQAPIIGRDIFKLMGKVDFSESKMSHELINRKKKRYGVRIMLSRQISLNVAALNSKKETRLIGV